MRIVDHVGTGVERNYVHTLVVDVLTHRAGAQHLEGQSLVSASDIE